MKRITMLAFVLLAVLTCAAATLRHFHVHQVDYNSFTVTCDSGKATASDKDGALQVTCK